MIWPEGEWRSIRRDDMVSILCCVCRKELYLSQAVRYEDEHYCRECYADKRVKKRAKRNK